MGFQGRDPPEEDSRKPDRSNRCLQKGERVSGEVVKAFASSPDLLPISFLLSSCPSSFLFWSFSWTQQKD